MDKMTTTAMAALLIMAVASPATAQLSARDEINIYDAPQQLDRFHIDGSTVGTDRRRPRVDATGSISAPRPFTDEPFYQSREYIRRQSERN